MPSKFVEALEAGEKRAPANVNRLIGKRDSSLPLGLAPASEGNRWKKYLAEETAPETRGTSNKR